MGKSDQIQSEISQAIHDHKIVGFLYEKLKSFEWISVEERLPQEGKEVLLLQGGGNYYIGSLVGDRENFDFVTYCGDCIMNPTHWMHLPEAPK